MPKYTKKPIEIEAKQLTVDTINDTAYWIIDNGGNATILADGIILKTLEGNMAAGFGDYIIQGVRGEFYPCKKEIFEETYQESAGMKSVLVSYEETLAAEEYIEVPKDCEDIEEYIFQNELNEFFRDNADVVNISINVLEEK